MATRDDVRQFVGSTTPPSTTRGWYGMCAGLTDRVVAAFTGGSRQWYDSATDARRSSGPLNRDALACPPGGIHFWSYIGTAWDGSVGDWGHVTIEIIGGGRGCLSATGYAYEQWALNAGLITVDGQSARPGMRYLGWARTYGAAAPLTITGESTAGDSAHPFEEDDMLNDDDKNWVRDTVRQEIGGALSAFADTYKDQNWAREAVRQEIGGALSAFTGQIADAVAARVEHPAS